MNKKVDVLETNRVGELVNDAEFKRSEASSGVDIPSEEVAEPVEEKALDEELGDSLIKLHDIEVEEEKAVIKNMTQGIALQTELVLEAEEIKEQIADAESQLNEANKATRRYRLMALGILVICIITAVARYIAW